MTPIGVLATVGAVVVWALLAVLALTIAAASIPLDALYDSARSANTFRITWLWGAVVLYPRSRKERGREGKGAKGGRKKKKKRSAGGPNPARRRAIIDLARDPAFRRRLLRDLNRLIRRIAIPLVDLRFLFGLADPADTGLVYGLLVAATATVGIDPRTGFTVDDRHRLAIEPLFDEESLSLEGRAHLRIVPIALIGTALRTAAGTTGRRVLGTLWRTRTR